MSNPQDSPDPDTDATLSPGAQAALTYHERTKHHPGRFARALGWLDWDTQPDPFRRWTGAPLAALPLPRPASGTDEGDAALALSYDALFSHDHPDAPPPRELDAASVSSFFFHALALSAWKSVETSRWSLRVNPSSGNLHPTEGWAVLPAIDGLRDAPAVTHYAPKEHGLEVRATLGPALHAALTDGLPAGGFLVALSSIPWREGWKYGERAWRYTQHDVGHALAALRLSAALHGWRLAALPDVPDADLSRLLGLDRTDEQPARADEPEHPDLLAVVTPADADFDPADWPLPETALAALDGPDARWHGTANTLSPDHHRWDVLDEVERACAKSADWCARHRLATAPAPPAHPRAPERDDDVPRASRILRQRRSAVAMDGKTGITAAALYDMLARTLPSHTAVPWDAQTWPTLVHLGIFVHRVAELQPGLYVLVRDPSRHDALREAMDDAFTWERPSGCPADLPFFHLRDGDARSLAASVSCGQDIAGDGAFSLGMLADFDAALRRHGAPIYRHLFWETGMIGQVLYLEPEAIGIRATGIGCFFDDPVHRAFGLVGGPEGHAFQSLYHFTVGGAVDDPRLSSEPAYAGTEL